MMYTPQHRTHPRASRVRIAVHADGRVVVTRPRRLPLAVAVAFAAAQRAWIARQVEKQRQKPRLLIARGTRVDYLQLRERARQLVYARLEHFAALYELSYAGVSIRDQKSRWGSCSAKKHLSFNYRIVLLPPELADYLIVHELCHLAEMNHSARFWEMVRRVVPEYRERAKALRRFALLDY